jgi:hypothetical protein
VAHEVEVHRGRSGKVVKGFASSLSFDINTNVTL